MVSVSEARNAILESCRLLAIEWVDLRDSVGRVLRSNAVADGDVPPFDNSAMDGFAVALSDFQTVPADLRIIEDIRAGGWPAESVVAGTCSRIMTGAPVPAGADAVAPVEWTEPLPDRPNYIRINRKPDPGQHIRRSGSDVRRGDVVLSSPLILSSHAVGALASCGLGAVPVSARPSVSIVATGDELVEASAQPTLAQIRNTNGPTLRALVANSGGVVSMERVAKDDLEDTRRVLEEAMMADIVVISGGVSVGSFDFVKEVIDALGFERRFWKVRQRPGKPLTFGTIGDKCVFGLPGNPVSTAVCFQEYVRPAIRKMLGLEPGPFLRMARLSETIDKVPSLHYFVPATAATDDDGQLSVSPSGRFGSHIFSSLATANCLLSLPEGPDQIAVGSLVDIELIDSL